MELLSLESFYLSPLSWLTNDDVDLSSDDPLTQLPLHHTKEQKEYINPPSVTDATGSKM